MLRISSGWELLQKCPRSSILCCFAFLLFFSPGALFYFVLLYISNKKRRTIQFQMVFLIFVPCRSGDVN